MNSTFWYRIVSYTVLYVIFGISRTMGFWNLNSGLWKFFHVTSTGASVVNYVQPRLSLWANIFVWNMMRMTRAGSSTEVDKLFVHVYKVACFTAHENFSSYLYLNRCVAGVCCKSARHWLTAAPQQLHTDNRWVWRRPSGHMTAVVFHMHSGDNCWHCYRLHCFF